MSDLFGSPAPEKRRRTGIAGVHTPNPATHDWITPPHIIEALGPFDLDPCQSPTQPWLCAARGYVWPADGLAEPWEGRVWCNPPYSVHAARWLERLARHPDGGTALIFARTETEMFFDWVWRAASGVLFLEGRLHFHHPDGSRAAHNAGGPSCLVAYGARDAAILEQCGLPGHFVRLSGARTVSVPAILSRLSGAGYRLEDDSLETDGRITLSHEDDAHEAIAALASLGFARTDAVWVMTGHGVTCEIEPGGDDTSGHLLHVFPAETEE